MECFGFNDVRNKHFVASSVKDSFKNVEAHSMIIDFIKETPFYKQLQCLQTLHINVCYLLFIVA